MECLIVRGVTGDCGASRAVAEASRRAARGMVAGALLGLGAESLLLRFLARCERVSAGQSEGNV